MWRWEWADDLFFPATRTGRMITKPTAIPIIGGGTELHEMLVPEYKPMRMTNKHTQCWIVTKWMNAATFLGMTLDYKIGKAPSITSDRAYDAWKATYPDMEYPSRGLRIPTDYATDHFKNKSAVPTLEDTKFFIRQAREQLSGMSADARLADMLLEDDRIRADKRRITEDICEDSFTAMLNPNPGSRGGFVSFPSQETSARKESNG